MHTYEAYVRIPQNNYVVKTQVRAESVQQAYFLLQGQFGVGNVVHMPSRID